MVIGEASAGKAWSLWKAPRPVWLPLSPMTNQPLAFSQNDGPTVRSVATPGITSDGAKGELPSGGGTSGGPPTVCGITAARGGNSASGATGAGALTRASGPPGRDTGEM